MPQMPAPPVPAQQTPALQPPVSLPVTPVAYAASPRVAPQAPLPGAYSVSRFKISFAGKQQARRRRNKRLFAFLLIALIVLVAAAIQITVMRSPQKLVAVNDAGEALNRTVNLETGNGAASDDKRSGTRKESRAEPRRTTRNPPPPRKESLPKRIWNKINPF
jgi:hypothetical protein